MRSPLWRRSLPELQTARNTMARRIARSFLGRRFPYTGPVSAAAPTGFRSTAYFDNVNKAGSINGRKIKLISADDAHSPPRALAVKRLVEGDGVLLIYGFLGVSTRRRSHNCLSTREPADPATFRMPIGGPSPMPIDTRDRRDGYDLCCRDRRRHLRRCAELPSGSPCAGKQGRRIAAGVRRAAVAGPLAALARPPVFVLSVYFFPTAHVSILTVPAFTLAAVVG